MDRPLIQGKTLEEKFISLEKILQSFQRRLGTKVMGIIPPVPIFYSQKFPSESGIIFSALIPLSGDIPKAFIRVGNFLAKDPTLTVTVATDVASSSAKVILKDAVTTYDLSWKISAGSIIEASIFPVNAVEDIFVAMLINPFLADTQIKSFLLEEFLAMEATQDAGIRAESEQVSSERIAPISTKRASRRRVSE